MKNENQLYKANEVLQYKYISIPKELFVNPQYSKLSSDSKLIYGFILDRFILSIKNQWEDEKGNVYLIFTRKEIQNLFHISDKTVTKAFKELTECKLIYEKRQGKNKPNLIYPYKMTVNEWKSKNYDSGTEKTTVQETENLRCNYTNNNYTNRVKGKKNSANFEQRNYDDFNFNTLLANYNSLI